MVQLNLHLAVIYALVTQHVVEALANRNVESKQGEGTGGDSTKGDISYLLRACNYKEFMKCTFEYATFSWWKSHVKTIGICIENAPSFSQRKFYGISLVSPEMI